MLICDDLCCHQTIQTPELSEGGGGGAPCGPRSSSLLGQISADPGRKRRARPGGRLPPCRDALAAVARHAACRVRTLCFMLLILLFMLLLLLVHCLISCVYLVDYMLWFPELEHSKNRSKNHEQLHGSSNDMIHRITSAPHHGRHTMGGTISHGLTRAYICG